MGIKKLFAPKHNIKDKQFYKAHNKHRKMLYCVGKTNRSLRPKEDLPIFLHSFLLILNWFVFLNIVGSETCRCN